MLVYFPELPRYIPQVLTESIYLFGLMLCITSGIEYILGKRRSMLWLSLGAVGLTLTLLARPVLQFFALGAMCMAALGTWYLQRAPHENSNAQALRNLINTPLCVALLGALLLPAAIVLKNGLCFGVWGISTGAGTGLYYGVSPFKMGLEPVFSGFRYDAGKTPLTVFPEKLGNPLRQTSDIVNRRVAINIVENTSVGDNLSFFAFKLKTWLLYSTPELQITPTLRTLRLFEWLTIASAAALLCIRSRRRTCSPTHWSGIVGLASHKLVVLAFLLAIAIAMAIQLTPVLYNGRYNLFFLEPWLILLTAVSSAILLAKPDSTHPRSLQRWLGTRVGLAAILVATPLTLTQHAVQHETWGMDPYRLGPTEVVLDSSDMGMPQASQGTTKDGRRWQVGSNPFILRLPLNPPDPSALTPEHMMDAIWRMRFAVEVPEGANSACRKAVVHLTNAYTLQEWFRPQPVLNLQVDGVMHTYALFGNDELRPAGAGELTITFQCPAGTYVTWGGAELLRSTLPEAAHQLIHHGKAINPYRLSEPE